MKKIKKILAENRIYILMLIFIALFNAALRLVPGIEKYSREAEEALKIQQLETKEEIEEREQLIAQNITAQQNLQNIAAVLTFLFTFMLLSGVAIFITFINFRLKRQKIVPRIFNPPATSWSVWDAVRLAVIFVFLNYIFFSIQAVLAEFFKIQIRDAAVKMIFGSLVMDSLSLWFILYFIRLRKRPSVCAGRNQLKASALAKCRANTGARKKALRGTIWNKFNRKLSAVGLIRKYFSHSAFIGILGYLGFLPILLAVIFISYLCGKYFHIEPQTQPMLDLFIGEKRLAVLIVLTLFVGVIGPVIEEIFFRGFLYSALKKKFAVPVSMFLASLIFAALHMNTFGFLPIFALALALVYMFETTGSLVPSIVIHCFHNGMIILFLFLSRFFSGR